MTDPLDDRLRRLDAAAERVLAAPDSGRKEALRRYLIGLGSVLVEERDALAGWLDRAWSWLDAHPDAADHAAREDRVIEKIDEYVSICDALSAARRGL